VSKTTLVLVAECGLKMGPGRQDMRGYGIPIVTASGLRGRSVLFSCFPGRSQTTRPYVTLRLSQLRTFLPLHGVPQPESGSKVIKPDTAAPIRHFLVVASKSSGLSNPHLEAKSLNPRPLTRPHPPWPVAAFLTGALTAIRHPEHRPHARDDWIVTGQ
jgi:hypothetical protein